MFWGAFFGLVIAAAVLRAEWAYELLCGIGLVGIVAGVVDLDPGMFLMGLAVVAGCCWRWGRLAR